MAVPQEIEEAQALGPNTSEEQRARLAQEIEHLKMEMERRRRKKQQEEEEKLQEEMEDVAYMPEDQAEGDDDEEEQLEGEAVKVTPPPAAPKGTQKCVMTNTEQWGITFGALGSTQTCCETLRLVPSM